LQKTLFGESGSDANEMAMLIELLDARAIGQPAAVTTEPLFSAGGVIEPPPGWLRRLAAMCHDRGMLLIVDEEQTGLGKLGDMFGFQAEGIVPDIITMAKHLGGGVGISALATTAAIEQKAVASGYAATHSRANDPLICAAGVASLDVIEQEDIPAKARQIVALDARLSGSARPALRDDRRRARARPTDGHRAGA